MGVNGFTEESFSALKIKADQAKEKGNVYDLIHTVEFASFDVVNQQSGSCLGRFLSLLPRLTKLIVFHCSFHDDFYREIAERALSSQIHTVKFDCLDVVYQQSGSCFLGRFFSLLPRLTDLTISSFFHDDFYREIAERALSSQIHTVKFDFLFVVNQQSGSCYLGRFLSLLPRLTVLTIRCCCFHGDFYREIAERASSSQIHTVDLDRLYVVNQQLGSCCLGRFLSLLPRLTHLTISCCSFHDDFYREIAERTSSSQIHTLFLGFQEDPHGPLSSSACKHLARFICCLPRLTTLTIACNEELLDDFFIDFASMAASSKIHTLVLGFQEDPHRPLSSSACKHLARFICCLPRLANLTITDIYGQLDDFFIDFASMAASSKSPYFMERKHIPLLDKYWPRWRELQSRAESSSSAVSTNHSEVEPSQHQGHPLD
ncbi:uncharacterized protein LOC121421239 [Lytechinus variegatus]|uniref:uncharacterized protein LOC121421239 n=1 Tax=Lytechinus variegatus TaxID=7654 RepID=UPI001BB2BE16|nr:uncharacterized protein LOC121421239 [Lytechinus variegatus]